MKKLFIIFFLFSFVAMNLFGCSNTVINESEATASDPLQQSAAKDDTDNNEDGKTQDTVTETSSGIVTADTQTDNVVRYQQLGSELVDDAMIYMFGGNSVDDVNETLGEADTETDMDGFTRCHYKQGVEIDIVKQNDKPVIFNYIYLDSTCSIKINDDNVGIGSSKDDVLKIFSSDINSEQSEDNTLVAGDRDIGIIFVLKNDEVSSIYIALGDYTGTTDPRDIP